MEEKYTQEELERVGYEVEVVNRRSTDKTVLQNSKKG